jgi:hypothetical protein
MKSSYTFAALALAVFLGLASVVAARPQLPNQANENAFELPETAAEVAKDVYYLGEARDVDGRLVEGYAYVYRRDAYAKPPWAGGGNNKGSSCYQFLSKGAKWKSSEDWVVNSSNSRGLNGSFVLSNLASDIGKWEDAANYNILGDGLSVNYPLIADTVSPDDNNEVYFSNISDPQAIAVTIVWGIWGGPPPGREIVEWDQVYDDVDFDWSSSGEPGKMDFENIATHELGHSVGLADLYESACSEETMFGYAGNGETKKQTLEAGDIQGALELYK